MVVCLSPICTTPAALPPAPLLQAICGHPEGNALAICDSISGTLNVRPWPMMEG